MHRRHSDTAAPAAVEVDWHNGRLPGRCVSQQQWGNNRKDFSWSCLLIDRPAYKKTLSDSQLETPVAVRAVATFTRALLQRFCQSSIGVLSNCVVHSPHCPRLKKYEQKEPSVMWRVHEPAVSSHQSPRSLRFRSTSEKKRGKRSSFCSANNLVRLQWVSEHCIISRYREFCNCKTFNKIPCYFAILHEFAIWTSPHTHTHTPTNPFKSN